MPFMQLRYIRMVWTVPSQRLVEERKATDVPCNIKKVQTHSPSHLEEEKKISMSATKGWHAKESKIHVVFHSPDLSPKVAPSSHLVACFSNGIIRMLHVLHRKTNTQKYAQIFPCLFSNLTASPGFFYLSFWEWESLPGLGQVFLQLQQRVWGKGPYLLGLRYYRFLPLN